MKKLRLLFITLLLFPLFACAAEKSSTAPTTFTAGKEYQLIEPAMPPTDVSKNKVLVQEFFSYGCPACYRLESTIQNWLKNKPDVVQFERVPVVFHEEWAIYAKAYYMAKALGIEHKITPDLYKAIQEQKAELANKEAMAKFFSNYGIHSTEFNNTYELSPGISIQLKHADNLMTAYKIYEIPTLVIAGKYKTNGTLVNSDPQKFIQLLNYLVALELKT